MLEALASLFIYWSDADSGKLPDGTAFRLHGVDAPETYRPKCDKERALGYRAKEYVNTRYKYGAITVTHDYGKDRYGRRVVDLSVNGHDVAQTLIRDGYAARWDYDGGAPKPKWCG